MGDLLFNIRFGVRHFMITKDFKFSIESNPHHIGNKKKLEVYTIFGKQLY